MKLKQNEVIVWLSHTEGVTNKDIKSLIDYFTNIEEVLFSDKNHIYKALNKRIKVADEIIENRNEQYINKIFEKLEDININPVTIFDDNYPLKLKNIYDPPYVIYIKGNKIKFDMPLIAIVGARKSTPYGRWAANQFAKELAKWNVGIISGLALGVDTCAHKGALDEKGYTMGVLGCGLDQCYPASNKNLMDHILVDGCMISEYPVGMPPLKHNFPARNRIVSGLSDGVVVIEASEKSGALITVGYALDQGKDVYALPGNINSMQSRGSNKLIRDGARILLEVEDIIENLKYKYTIQRIDSDQPLNEDLSKLEYQIYEIIKKNPVHIDLIINETGIKTSELNSILTILELKGYINQISGKTFTALK